MLRESFPLKFNLKTLPCKFPSPLIVVDMHTCGAPARLLTGGFPPVKGENIHEQMAFFSERLDYIRAILMQEPRGHESSYGAVLLPPTTPEEDISCLFMHNTGYSSMCGHVSIAIGSLVRQMNTSKVSIEAQTRLRLRTLAGGVHLDWSQSEATPTSVSCQNVPSFCHSEIRVSLSNGFKIPVSISFGGNFYALINAENLSEKFYQLSILELTEIGEDVLSQIDKSLNLSHPLDKSLTLTPLVMFYNLPGKTCGNTRVFTTWGYNKFDRSPCGTGASALVAYMHAKKQLSIGESYMIESVIGTLFHVQLIQEIKIGPYQGVIPRISGESYITGFNQVVVDPNDLLGKGLKVSPKILPDDIPVLT